MNGNIPKCALHYLQALFSIFIISIHAQNEPYQFKYIYKLDDLIHKLINKTYKVLSRQELNDIFSHKER